MINFYCNKCGICCQKVGESPLTSFLANESGICKYYDTTTKLCTIYDNRPLVCNVDEFYEKHYLTIGLSKAKYYELNYDFCKKWQEEDKAH